MFLKLALYSGRGDPGKKEFDAVGARGESCWSNALKEAREDGI